MTFTSRAELGEANGKLLIRGGYENETILLTSNEALHPADVVGIINQTTNWQVELVLTTPEEYVKFRKDNDESKKSENGGEDLDDKNLDESEYSLVETLAIL